MNIVQRVQEYDKELNGGTFLLDTIRVGHTTHEIETLLEIIQNIHPDWFIEIGVHEGGLSWLFIPELKNIHYLGIEIDCGIVRPEVKDLYESMNAQLYCADCFAADTISLVKELPGRKIIYCDGGNKAKELIAYKETLNIGDWILAHDYWDGKRKIFDCEFPNAEVTPQDIEIYRKDHNFVELGNDDLLHCRIVGFLKYE